MKIGILLCGDVPPSLVEEFGNYASCLQRQLNLNRYGDVTIWNLYEKSELPEHTDICDVYIIGGSPAGVNDNLDWINALAGFIRNVFCKGKKLFGICFGHQIIHHALGGVVARSPDGWGIGPYSVTFLQNFEKIKTGTPLSLLAIHQDQVVEPAKSFNVVAGNYFCPNYMTRFKKQVLTIQGHPEFNFLFFSALINQRKDILSKQASNAPFEEGNSSADSRYFNTMINLFIFER
ncbi:MAG: GMP synthase-like glutamine amidotransferase [Psychromonas sp.]|jgi:GMP synthase-like glutamine amidotransferase|uniref:type 1 glutamine amidotransferase n=1 Tax=Psychromonas sp. TaxID=1884585 RepID=UPI0039E3E472